MRYFSQRKVFFNAATALRCLNPRNCRRKPEMSYRLLTTQAEHDAAFDEILPLAARSLKIFDRDLSLFRVERPAAIEQLSRLLTAGPDRTVDIAVQDAAAVQSRCPRLIALLAVHGHHLRLIQTAEQLDGLTDAFMIADDRHCLVRFHRDQPRGKAITDDPDSTQAYVDRFESIWSEGGTPIGAMTLGL